MPHKSAGFTVLLVCALLAGTARADDAHKPPARPRIRIRASWSFWAASTALPTSIRIISRRRRSRGRRRQRPPALP